MYTLLSGSSSSVYIHDCMHAPSDYSPLTVDLEVDSLNSSVLCLNWTAPFVSNMDPVANYCVDIIRAVNNSAIDSECGIMMTTFCYPIPPDSNCNLYLFTVTPVDAKEGNQTQLQSTLSYIEYQRGTVIFLLSLYS